MVNPILSKEFHIQMRDRMLFSLAMVYVAIICSVVFGMFWFASTSNKPIDPQYGRDIFLIFFIVMNLAVYSISAGIGSKLISQERQKANFDLLKITLLKTRHIILGKILPLFAYIMMLMLLSLPLAIVIMPISGLSIAGVVLCYLIAFISAITFSIIGLMWSSLFRNVRTSTALTYISCGIIAFGTIIAPLALNQILKIKLPQISSKIISSLSPFISVFRIVTESDSSFVLAEWELMVLGYLVISAIAISITSLKLRNIFG